MFQTSIFALSSLDQRLQKSNLALTALFPSVAMGVVLFEKKIELLFLALPSASFSSANALFFKASFFVRLHNYLWLPVSS
jgi:hypothetical protein